jgi:hypothetical protein
MKELYGCCMSPNQYRKFKDNNNIKHRMLRQRALDLYGAMCACCGETNINVLTFDHINGGGTQARKALGNYSKYYEDIIANYPSSKFRILCWNCNESYGHFGYCPHESVPDKVLDYQQKYRHRLKSGLIAAYGGRCELCGTTKFEFLTIDHVNGGGSKHFAELRLNGGQNLYRVLRDLGYPKDEYRLLCYNCNCGGKDKSAANV